jgi:hypothetical protein
MDKASHYRMRRLLRQGHYPLRERTWTREDETVQMGTGIHCAGCGRLLGVACVVMPESGWTPPPQLPPLIFRPEDCRVCAEWR